MPRYLREIILEDSTDEALNPDQRLHLFEWCTALGALPCNGLKIPIMLRHWAHADEHDLPSVHTCTHEVHLPAYRSCEQLRQKILMAIEHRHDGFHIE